MDLINLNFNWLCGSILFIKKFLTFDSCVYCLLTPKIKAFKKVDWVKYQHLFVVVVFPIKNNILMMHNSRRDSHQHSFMAKQRYGAMSFVCFKKESSSRVSKMIMSNDLPELFILFPVHTSFCWPTENDVIHENLDPFHNNMIPVCSRFSGFKWRAKSGISRVSPRVRMCLCMCVSNYW